MSLSTKELKHLSNALYYCVSGLFIQIAMVANCQFLVNIIYYPLTNQTKKIVSVTNVK